MKKLIVPASMAIMILLAACSSTKVTSSWKSDEANKLNYRQVLVLGLMPNKDRSIRMNMENELAEELKGSGVNAIAASTVFSPNQLNNMNEQRALRFLRNKGYDAVMTIVLLDKAKEKNYVPGNVSYQPYGGYYSRFWGYYRTVYGRVYTPGYYTTSTNYFWESNLYSVADNKMLYSVQSKSFDPSEDKIGRDYAKQITRDMLKQGVLVKK
ncbi:hypothetical protein D3H65_05220 [Paraflavitalea soli]|uniref:DUF4136 domain-containing protein n=1 Tax=Paraflavitalea soli TaxID=2315862 RepID=A0A3B7MGD3_9BACT|nr:hypothetical protein [Paraflavitalea soli]AXY73412.1 hypothetical protein D3H65_05220 [Paraflavitalea soli]